MKLTTKYILVASLAVAVLDSASAQVITYQSAGAGVFDPMPVLSDDAANAGSSFLSGWSFSSGSAIFGSSLVKINDGIFFENVLDRGNTTFTLTPSSGAVVVVDFTSGLFLTGINTYAASGSGQLRSAQDYGLEYSLVGSSSYTSLFTSLNTSDPNNINSGNTSTKVLLDFTGLGGGGLNNVDSLRFTFATVGGNETMYREIDVIAVPEPSSAMMVIGAAFGGVALLRRRRV
ncbi:MAG: PEP-CTERM sorting domain-containing protein [Terrimicrobiaceae bacterium]